MTLDNGDTKARSHDTEVESLKNPDLAPINVFEEYRRAKRNSLIWSSASLLASIGIANSQLGDDTANRPQITLSWVATGIEFPPFIVVASFFLTALYMWLSWFWARERMSLVNSPLLFDKNLSDLNSILNKVNLDLIQLSKRLESDHFNNRANEKALQFYSDFFSTDGAKFLGLDERYELAVQELEAHYLDYTSSSDFNERALEMVVDQAIKIHRFQSKSLSNFQKVVRERLLELGKEDKILLRQTQGLLEEVREFERTVSGLAGFHQKVSLSERSRLMLLDVAPINVLMFLAVTAAMISLMIVL